MYVKGQWNAVCPVDGNKYKSSEMRKRWDGEWVHKSNWEPRHPQDFVRRIKDDPSVPWTRPERDLSSVIKAGLDISFSGSTISSTFVSGQADSGTDLSVFTNAIEVQGSLNNNGAYTFVSSSVNSIIVSETFTDEVSGRPITISQNSDSSIYVDPDNDTQPEDL